MSTKLYPQSWLDMAGQSESEPLHTAACEAAGVDPSDPDACVLLVQDASAIGACNQAGANPPGCDADMNLDQGSVYAVCGFDGEYCQLVHVVDGQAVRI